MWSSSGFPHFCVWPNQSAVRHPGLRRISRCSQQHELQSTDVAPSRREVRRHVARFDRRDGQSAADRRLLFPDSLRAFAAVRSRVCRKPSPLPIAGTGAVRDLQPGSSRLRVGGRHSPFRSRFLRCDTHGSGEPAAHGETRLPPLRDEGAASSHQCGVRRGTGNAAHDTRRGRVPHRRVRTADGVGDM